MVKYSIIIPTYNRPAFVDKLLSDIVSQNYDISKVEVIIFDDSPNNDIVKVVKKYSKSLHLHLIKVYNPVGSSVARNECITRANGDYAIFLDDDVRLPNDFLSTVDALTTKFDYFTFNVKNIPPVKGIIKKIESLFIGKLFLKMGLIFGGFDLNSYAMEIYSVQHFPGCCFIAKLDTIKSLNIKFDKYIGKGNGYLDDCDFSYTLYKLGQKLYFIPTYSIFHVRAPVGGNRERDYKKWLYYYWNHKAYFVTKHGKRWYVYIAFIPNLLECVLLCILKRENYLKMFLEGWRDGLRRLHRY